MSWWACLLANLKNKNKTIDGLNQWTAIELNSSSPRTKMVYNIDDETVPARLDIHEKRTTFQVKKIGNKIPQKILCLSDLCKNWKVQAYMGYKIHAGETLQEIEKQRNRRRN